MRGADKVLDIVPDFRAHLRHGRSEAEVGITQ